MVVVLSFLQRVLLLRLIKMIFFSLRRIAIISLFVLFSIVNALHKQALSSPKHHVRRTDKQVALESSPEYSYASQPFMVSTSTPSPFNQSNAQQSTFATGGSDHIISQDTNSHISIPPAPIPLHVQEDGCSDASSRMLVMGYYPDWAYPAFLPENVDFGRYDWIDFAFVSPNADFALVWDDMDSGPKLLKRLVAAAHAGGSKVKLSIGGWTGSEHFSLAVASDESRKTFASNILAAYKSFKLDGIDLDWEYPGRQGAEGNSVDSKDSSNFLSFLTILRNVLPATARISAAVQTITFSDTQAHPMTDMTDFAHVLDWVLLMNYDVWGSSSEPGPNAPLHDACGNSTQPDANAVAAFNAWTAANFPPCKLVLGVPSYGYISESPAERLRTRSAFSSIPQTGRSDSIRVVEEDGDSDGQVQFRNIVKQGALVRSHANGRPIFSPSGGFERRWDRCSDTPFLRSTSSGQIITYDDPESLAMKATFARRVGMLGVNMFDIHGDMDEWDLIDSVRKSLGIV